MSQVRRPAKLPHPAAEVWIVGVAWQARAATMAPFTMPLVNGDAASLPTTAAALIEAVLLDASLPFTGSVKIFGVGPEAVEADLKLAAGAKESITSCETLAAAVFATLATLQVEPETTCLIGAMGQTGQPAGACLILETAARARARGVSAYAVLATAARVGEGIASAALPDPEIGWSGSGELFAALPAVGWLELPAGQKDVALAKQIFTPDAAVLADALCSASQASAEKKGVRDTLALIRAALALEHKILPLVRPHKSELGTAGAAALPWIHPLPLPGHPAARVPRCAGWFAAAAPDQAVYLLLQEAAAEPSRADPVPFDKELFVFGADSPAVLRAQLVAFSQRVHWTRTSELDIASLAYQTAQALPSRTAYRLSVVTGSLAELERQLQELTAKLSPKTLAGDLHQPSSGIYCGSGLRGPEAGLTAFLFPGLGASYPYMLGDLCLHFPAIREVFDRIDFVAADLGENTTPSQQVFPRLGAPSQAPITGAAVITLLMAEWALAEFLRELGIAPDVLMGCSTGEFAALCQGGSINEVAAVPMLYRLSLAVARGLAPAQLATLQTVLVAAAVESLTPLFRAAPGPLYVSADLGADCTIIVGELSAVEWLLAALSAQAVTAHVLPSGVPYHTPLLNSAAVRGATELHALTVVSPKLPIWSCATADLYPADPAAILRDASALFIRSIALRDTIEAMYQSGVRTFVEVGPGEGLGRRVSAILGSRPHVRLASNLQQRTGVAQILHLLGALHALGYPLNLAPLFRRRTAAPAPFQPDAKSARTQRLPSLPRRLWPDSRSGTALSALTLALPHAERWSCLRIDRWELFHAGARGNIDQAAIFSAAELQRAHSLPLCTASLLTGWAAKRAVQSLISRLVRREIALPAIELTITPSGEPCATGHWIDEIGGAPLVATADCGEAAVALVAAADLGMRIGIQISQATALPVEDAQAAVCRALFPAQRISPSELQVAAADPFTGWIALRSPGHQTLLHARALRIGAYFVTIAALPWS